MVQYVGNLLKTYEYTAKERGITFKYLPALDKLDVWFDRKAMDKLVDNLLSNAFKYTYDNGEIDVRVAQTENGMALLQVIDNGMGIKGDVRKLFERFYQVDKTAEGSGLGLAIAKATADQNHWNLSATSDKKLTTFKLVF